VPLSKMAKVKRAIEGYEEFTGNSAGHIDELDVNRSDVAFKFGKCDGILYTTNRDGKTEKYIHEFKAKSRPTLVSNYDGSHIELIGGDYSFTDRGITDN